MQKEPQEQSKMQLESAEQTVHLTTNCFYGPTISPGRLLAKTLLTDLCGPVKAVNERTRKRKAEKATVLTSSPYKKLLEEKAREKSMPKKRKGKSEESKEMGSMKKSDQGKDKSVPGKKTRKCEKVKPRGRGKKETSKKKKAEVQLNLESAVARCICGVFEGSENDTDGWIQCTKCGKWMHEHCAELNGIFDDDFFYCSNECLL
jgi:hypothetical protein